MGALDERLDFDAAAGRAGREFVAGEFAGDDDAGQSQFPCGLHAGGGGDAGLGAEVEVQAREVGRGGEEGGVGDQHGVHMGVGGALECAERQSEFALDELDVERQVGFGAGLVDALDGLWELVGLEVGGASAGVESAESEVDGVGAGVECGLEGVGGAGGGEDFGGVVEGHG